MLRSVLVRLSAILICLMLFAFVTPTVEAQRTFQIGNPDFAGFNGVDPDGDPNVYYYDSLEALWADSAAIVAIDQGTDNIELLLFANQEVTTSQVVNRFFTSPGSISDNRQITFTTQGGQKISIGPVADSTGLGGGINLANGSGSVLQMENVDFTGNTATRGAAIFAGQGVTISVAGVEFNANTATNDGGAAYLQGGNVGQNASLDFSHSIFAGNRAQNGDGGAIYAKDATSIVAQNVTLQNNAAREGGAIYFDSDNSTLDVSRENSQATIRGNQASGDGGAIRMQDNSTLTAAGTVFNQNAAGGSGGAIRMDGNAGGNSRTLAKIHAHGVTFTENSALADGGAIFINDLSMLTTPATLNLLNLDGSFFKANDATNGSGGAIHTTNSVLNANDATFDGNTAGLYGGALFVQDSDLNLRGSSFTRNTAGNSLSTTGKGGAIYFLTTNDQNRSIYLGADANKASSFTGNTMNGQANSIYFETSPLIQSNVTLGIDVAENAKVNMADPMKVDTTGNNLNLDIVKTGSGTWSLGGVNDFTFTKVGASVDIEAGVFELAGPSLLLTNADGQDRFLLNAGASFVTKTGVATLQTTRLDFVTGSNMRLGGDLLLNVAASQYTIGSTLSGAGHLTKEDTNHLIFDGATNDFQGNVSITAGRLSIEKNDSVTNSGRFVTAGTFDMAVGTRLDLYADVSQGTLVARSVAIDGVDLTISGIGGNYQEAFTLIRSTDGITGNFRNVRSDGSLLNAVDYLTYDLNFSDDRKEYGGTIGLRWYSDGDSQIPAWGCFTVDTDFTVDVVLQDNNVNRYTGLTTDPGYDPGWTTPWDGKSLDKLGLGTLVLSARNTYTGTTTVHEGELKIAHAQGTGVGEAAVTVHKNARLGLAFDGKYEKTVSGEGKIVVYDGVIELSGNNSYSGGTELSGGVLEFASANNIGTGTLVFTGGTLRNKAEAILSQNVKIEEDRTAKLDVVALSANMSAPSLSLNGVISGSGNMEKTGRGILALNGQNTFTGVSYAKEGGLHINGGVAGDVRVSRNASVGGKGRIGGGLFLNPGGYFDWNYAAKQSDSGPLNVTGAVTLSEGAVFRPRAEGNEFTESIDGWTILTYGKALGGRFADTIDNTFNPFYEFTLDYSVEGEIRANGELLSKPRAQSDIVVTSLALANKKLYRNAFDQMTRETMYRKVPASHDASVRGQAASSTRSVWYTPMARANQFGTTFVGGDYDFQAYGMQAGSTLWSDYRHSLGVMFGYERGDLRNRLDQIRSHDYYLGLYYGQLFGEGYEFRAFVGGGFQEYTMFRSDTAEHYKAGYDGSSFEMNVELAKLYAGRNGTLIRPYIAADLEHGAISSAHEAAVGNAYRHYDKADLSQLFLRFGFDVEKRWQFVDLNAGLGYSIMVMGKRQAEASIFYPARGAATNSYSARLGRSALTLKTGLNWHLNRQRTNSFFIDYLADLYMDRAGDGVMHTGAVGFQVRF